MRNVSDESCRGNHNTHFMFNNIFSENHAIYEIAWKKKYGTDREAIRDNKATAL